MDGMVLANVLLLVASCTMIVVCIILVRRERKEKEALFLEVAEAKTKFLSQISKDIKTPMNVIIGTAALGLDEPENPEKMKEYLGRIQAASRFLMGILNDLVDMSKIETGKFKLHPKPYSFNDFLEEVRVMIEPECRKKQIAFVMPEKNGINLMVDPMRFSQIFFNLLKNAVKFTPEGGEVVFKVCNYAIHNNYFSADYVVKDNGIGMSNEFQKLLFEPFTKENEDVAEQKNGAGLGLAVTRNIVGLMGGTIEIKSELGIGTEVKVHLEVEIATISPERQNGYSSMAEVKKILQGKRVLLVEDHPPDIEITRHVLEKQGMKVVCAEDGYAAIEMFECEREHYFDLILMDISMPQMDGFETARRIRRMPQADAQTVPIIAMSSNDMQDESYACKEAGMDTNLVKPMEPKQLYAVLCEYIENPI